MTIESLLQYVSLVAAIAGVIRYMQVREDRLWKRIAEMDKEVQAVKLNYINRFQSMHDAIDDVSKSTLNALHELETNLRSSVHGLREDLAKFIGRLEAAKDR